MREKVIKMLTIEQWFKNGDHTEDGTNTFIGSNRKIYLCEGKVIRHFRRPDISGWVKCITCGYTLHEHGWIDSGGKGYIVCPGDWIVKSKKGRFFPYNFKNNTQIV